MTILRQNVAFDLDGTLVDTQSLFKRVVRDIAQVDVLENGKFQIETQPPITDSVIWEAFRITFKNIEDIPITPGAVELLTKLYEATSEPPLIITARPHWAANDTYRLLNHHLEIPFRLLLVNGGHNKLMYLHGIDNFVDDRRKIAKHLVHHGKHVFVPKAHYNWIGFPVDNLQFIDSVADLIPCVNDLLRTDVRYA